MTNNTSTSSTFNQPQYWAKWVLVNLTVWLIWALLNFLLLVIVSAVNLPAEMGLLVPVIFLMIVGAVLGSAQWWVLRQQVPQSKNWIIFTALGFAVGALFDLVFAGLGVGLVQWLLLRNVLNKSGWWPVINAVAWPVGYLVGGMIGALVSQLTNSMTITVIVVWASFGAIVGAITGAVLLWMLRENRALLDGLREEAKRAK